jgi:hypothetical protein
LDSNIFTGAILFGDIIHKVLIPSNNKVNPAQRFIIFLDIHLFVTCIFILRLLSDDYSVVWRSVAKLIQEPELTGNLRIRFKQDQWGYRIGRQVCAADIV